MRSEGTRPAEEYGWRRWFLAALNPLVWRSRPHAAARFFDFARAEISSSVDLRHAAALTPSPRRRALYLGHALDEERHARLFAGKARELRHRAGLAPYGSPAPDTDDLYERLGETGFVALVFRGERRGRQQFESYQAYFTRQGHARTGALFAAVLNDERRHEAYTWHLLCELAGSEQRARRELWRVGAWEAWRTWRRASRALVHPVYVLLMTVLYVACGPLAWLVQRLRPERRGWQAGERTK